MHLANADAPTPAVSFAVKDKGAIGGVMITASHNPPRYNGIKLKAANGGSALAEDTRRVEVLLDKGSPVLAQHRRSGNGRRRRPHRAL